MSIEIERAVLGGLMEMRENNNDLSNYCLSRLKPSFFTVSTLREIYKAIKLLALDNKMFDTITVSSRLKENQLVQLLDVDQCFQYRSDAGNIRSHIEQLRDASIERYAKSKIMDIVDLVSNSDNGNIKQRLGLAESSLSSMISSIADGSGAGLKNGVHWSNEWMNNLESFHSGEVDNFTLGFEGLDEILQPKGIRPGSLVVVGARPKMGKTFFATRVAEHYISERDEACCIFSMEMGGSDIYERILSGYSKVNSNDYYTNDFDEKNFWDVAGHQNANMAHTKILIDDAAGVSINHIKSEVRKAHRQNKVGCVIVDYLTVMGGDEKAERNDLKYGEITKQLKILGKELGCMILLLIQLNRGLENRPDKRPVPSDGRDTGQIEQDCDVWIGLYRESVYDKECPYNYTEAIIRLNRPGANGTGYLTLQNGYFENVDTLEAQSVINNHKDQKEEDSKAREEEHAKSRSRYARK